MKRLVKVEEAVGKVICHDITEVDLERNFKGVAFKKGHVITPEDIPKLKALGKEHIYVLEIEEGHIHEDEAAVRLAEALMGENTYRDQEPAEGKINIYSSVFGVVHIDTERLFKFNSIGEPSCATVHHGTVVKEGDRVASVRIISLIAPEKEIEEAEKVGQSIVNVRPLAPKKAGLIITGNEIYHGKVKDRFYEKLRPKLKELLVEIEEKVILPDNTEAIAEKIAEFATKYHLVILTGGTSVDPDDVTPAAMRMAGAQDMVRGVPMQPGNMLTIGYIDDKPVVAVPAAALFFRATSLDVWLPLILTGEKITREKVAAKGHGGLCLRCQHCHYPICPFGR